MTRINFRGIASLVFSLILAESCAQDSAKNASPDSLGSRFVAAVNSANRSEQEAALREIYSPKTLEKIGLDKLVNSTQRHHSVYSPLEYHHSERLEFQKPSGTNYVLHVYARKKGAVMWQDFQFFLEPEPPHLIQNLVFIAEVAEPISLPNGSIEQKNTLDWLDKYIQKLEAENDLSGSILIAKGDAPIFEKNWGYANAERTKNIGAETLFGLASGSKMFTALAILQLQEQGKLKLTDPLTAYFPDFPDRERAEKTTLQNLLSHTSGLAEYWTLENEPAMLTFTDWHQFLPLIYRGGYQFEPGTEHRYCNSNFMLLGAIIEKASGQDFYTYINDNILAKSGMAKSGYFDHADPTLPIASTFSRSGDGKGWKIAKHFKKGSPAGGCYSNTADMFLFCKALKNNKLVSAATLKNMVTDQTIGLKEAEPYGLGFILTKSGDERAYGHGGIAAGVNFEFMYFPKLDITFIAFNNQDNGAYDDLRKNVIKLISGLR